MLTRIGGLARRLVASPARIAGLGLAGAGTAASFVVYADAPDFFKYSFKTTKDPDAIVDFYSTEDFLQVLGIFPFAISFILAGVEWDTKRENTNCVYNTMAISFDITEKEEEIDGKDVVTFFNKRERFINYVPFTNIVMWDQVQNYGYRRLDNGELEVTHTGEHFYGPWPARLLITLHARYVIWATEKHINSPLFGTDDLEAQEHQRSNVPLHVANEWLQTLTDSQGSALQRKRLQTHQTQHQEATQAGLVRLQRTNTNMTLERTATGGLKLRITDPEAQKVIRAALRDIKAIHGSEAAESALKSLLQSMDKEQAAAMDTKQASAAATGITAGATGKVSLAKASL